MNTLYVTHSGGEYPILIGDHLLESAEIQATLRSLISGTQIFILTDQTVSSRYLSRIQSLIHAAKKEIQCHYFLLPKGDDAKTITVFTEIMDACITHELHRDVTFIALGGGAIGDITGFAAACYQRGVRWINFPTTLLAQVDASIGGKTAINHHCYKNMIGAFHPPSAVIIDITMLNSLADREFRAGISEIIKVALILDADFFQWLENNMTALLARDPATLLFAIQRACELKCSIVIQDEKEQGLRALLNLGHTFAHAMEASPRFNDWLHGEAVAWGILLASRLSLALNMLNHASLERIEMLLTQFDFLRPLPNDFSADDLLKRMKLDKKVKDDQLRLILLSAIGKAVIQAQVSDEKIRDVFIQNHAFPRTLAAFTLSNKRGA